MQSLIAHWISWRNITMDKLKEALKLQTELINQRIIVHCLTCNTSFLNMSWKEYLPIINGDFTTPTKWYNEVALHYCNNPTHEILSNKTFLQDKAVNNEYNFTTSFNESLSNTGLLIGDLLKVVLEERIKAIKLPI